MFSDQLEICPQCESPATDARPLRDPASEGAATLASEAASLGSRGDAAVGSDPTREPSTDAGIYRTHAESVVRFFLNKVSVDADVAELRQRTFVRFLELRARGTTVSDPGPFLIGIAKNVLFEYWREKAKLARQDPVGAMPIAEMGAGVSTLIARAQDQRLLLDALREIRLDHQIVIELFYWDGRTREQIAEVMGVAPATISTWLYRGRERLRKLIAVGLRATGRPPRSLADEDVEGLLERAKEAMASVRVPPSIDFSKGD